MSKYNQDVYTFPRVASKQYLHTTQAGAWLPLAQAIITGLIMGFSVFTLGLVFDTRHPEKAGLVVAFLAMAATWLLLQRHWFSLTGLERLTGLDINRDGRVGDEPPAEVRVRVQDIKPNGHYQETIYHLPGTTEQLATLAAGLIEGGLTFSERSWTGAGNPFSVDEFRRLRSELIRRGCLTLANPKDSRQGYALTVAGRHALAAFLPSPTDNPENV